MGTIISNAISGMLPNNGGSISVNVGKNSKTFVNNISPINTGILNDKYQDKFVNDIEYNLWPPSNFLSNNPYVTPTPTKTINYTVTPTKTPTKTPTPTRTTTPTTTVTPTVTPTITLTSSVTPSSTVTPTATPTTTPTKTPTATITSSVTPSPTIATEAGVLPNNGNNTAPIIMTNSANYNGCADALATVGTSGRSSYYGAFDMNGNVWEWTETDGAVDSKILRGGNYAYSAYYLISSTRASTDKSSFSQYLGFRVASSQPYPSLSLVGDINNTADANGYGNVSSIYYIGKYEVTNNDYIEFLNSIAKTDTYSLYIDAMSWSNLGGILRSGSSGSYTYTAKNNMLYKPVNFVSWNNCARYCNWLHNGKPTGSQNTSTTENGAYNITLNNPSRNINATFFIPTENEWYKAAYYKGGSSNAGYWIYATQSDSPPNCVQLTSTGDGIPV